MWFYFMYKGKHGDFQAPLASPMFYKDIQYSESEGAVHYSPPTDEDTEAWRDEVRSLRNRWWTSFWSFAPTFLHSSLSYTAIDNFISRPTLPIRTTVYKALVWKWDVCHPVDRRQGPEQKWRKRNDWDCEGQKWHQQRVSLWHPETGSHKWKIHYHWPIQVKIIET